MTPPWNYRPDPGAEEGWDDTLGSNLAAWIADAALPRWCKTPDHWSARISNYWHADCPCCLFWRGAALGIALGFIAGLTAGIII